MLQRLGEPSRPQRLQLAARRVAVCAEVALVWGGVRHDGRAGRVGEGLAAHAEFENRAIANPSLKIGLLLTRVQNL